MSLSTPYTYIQCPCSDQPALDEEDNSPNQESIQDEERTFDPRAPRSNYSLYPLEYLLFCEDCQQIRCPKCVNEEVVTYFCPNCLFEVPSSNLRSEGNRCTRSCYQCPVCTGPVQVSAVEPESSSNLLTADNAAPAHHGPYALFCSYCNWSSSEIGIEFEKSSGIPGQLAKLKNGGEPRITIKEVKERRKENPDTPPVPDELVDTELQFSHLKAFYQSQLSDVSGGVGGLSLNDGTGFSSPAALTRIMSLYTTGRGSQRQQGPPDVMREALTTDDGLKLAQLDEDAAVKKLHSGGWEETVSQEQRLGQLEPPRFQDELRPTQCILRTKRSKRCAACRHIISKPENKVASTRFRIRLVAKSNIPKITIKPLKPTSEPIPVALRPAKPQEAPMKPMQPYQYVLTFNNPRFEKINVTLATPNNTPGRFSSKVTLFCPQFEVDANTDSWTDALREDGADVRPGEVEVGKIYERGRNWVSIILEVIPPFLRPDSLPTKTASGEEMDRGPLKEDEDILEIPMFVRMEWEAGEAEAQEAKDKDASERRELAYWCVLGVGRISHE